MSSTMLSASTIKGQPINNLEDQELGHIEDIMINLEGGDIAYVVLSFGGLLGVGDKLFAIPYKALTPDPAKTCFRLDVSKIELEAAPGFDKQNWPTVCDENFMCNLRGHYGAEQ